MRLPLLVKQAIAAWLRWSSLPKGRNDAYADLLECLHPQSVAQERALAVVREEYRARWIAAMREQGIDFVLNVPHALPPMPKDGSGVATLVSASYCFLYNIVSLVYANPPEPPHMLTILQLDFTAGVVPTTFVNKDLDALPPNFTQSDTYLHFNDAERAVYSLYDAQSMHGLPLGVQVAGKRFEEEKVLEGMQFIERALHASRKPFVQREFGR